MSGTGGEMIFLMFIPGTLLKIVLLSFWQQTEYYGLKLDGAWLVSCQHDVHVDRGISKMDVRMTLASIRTIIKVDLSRY